MNLFPILPVYVLHMVFQVVPTHKLFAAVITRYLLGVLVPVHALQMQHHLLIGQTPAHKESLLNICEPYGLNSPLTDFNHSFEIVRVTGIKIEKPLELSLRVPELKNKNVIFKIKNKD